MKPVLLDSYQSVTQKDIARFEQQMGIALPEDYRSFLCRTNGGVFHDEVCTPDLVVVDGFYGLNSGFEWSDLECVYERTREWISPKVLAIASSPSGDEIGVSLEEDTIGQILQFYHDASLVEFLEMVDESDERSDADIVADSGAPKLL